MNFNFKQIDEAIFTTEPLYDLIEGGYIKPEDLLENPLQAEQVKGAISLIKNFIEQAESAEVIEIG